MMIINFTRNDAFILDQMNTWPNGVLDLLNRKKELFHSYFLNKESNDLLQKRNPTRQIILPNSYEEEFDDVVGKLDHILEKCCVIGFHCSRLTSFERISILKNGLKPLSKKLIRVKLQSIYEHGFISKKLYEYLSDNNFTVKKHNGITRTNVIFCFHAIKTFEDREGLCRLLNIWGGESIYWIQDQETRKILTHIGEPSIVVLRIPYVMASQLCKISSKMVDIFYHNICRDHIFTDIDNFFKTKLQAIDIITPADNRFETLTEFSKWEIYL